MKHKSLSTILTRLKVCMLISLLYPYVCNTVAVASEGSARKKAFDFFNSQPATNNHKTKKTTDKISQVTLSYSTSKCFVYNNEKGGFAIISDVDDENCIMAYSETGHFDSQNIPQELSEWIDAYTTSSSYAESHPAIEPMLTMEWGQGLPYNLDVPSHYPTGCVSTALAQVMAYHKWPLGTSKEIGDLPVATFDWGKLKDTYSSTDEDASALEVAKLMHYCGVSVGTNYGNSGTLNWGNGSPAYFYNAAEALKYYYGYAKTARDVYRSSWNSEEWDSLIYNELANGRPVIYSANEKSGHAMVIDGYDGKGGYHINWGWNGDFNGFYKFPDLNGYTLHHAAIVGIEKAVEQYEYSWKKEVSLIGEWSYHSVYSRNSDGELGVGFKINLTDGNNYEEAGGLYRNHQLIEVLPYRYSTKISDTGTYIHSVRIGSHIPDGAYQLRFLYRETGKEEWIEPLRSDGELFDLYIKDDRLSITECSDAYGLAEENDIEILGISMEGNRQVNSPQTIKIKLQNRGKRRTGYFYFRIDRASGSYIYDGSLGYAINPEETGDVEYVFMPDKADDYTASISIKYQNRWYTKETFSISDESSGIVKNGISKGRAYTTYTSSGIKTHGHRGLNIVRYDDGTVRKVIIK